MSDVLGSCPVCGHPGGPEIVHRHYQPRAECANGMCLFECTIEHWSLLRRKMTREEAETLLAPFHGSPDMGATDEQPTTAQWAALKSALTGEKT